jgi:cytochrome oxidase assembly protein ShyY1
MTQSFAKVALTPKWLGALALALALAAIFAILGQWQLSRALTTTAKPFTTTAAIAIDELSAPGAGFKTTFTNRIVTAEVTQAVSVGRVASRKQQGTEGYWSVAVATLKDGSYLVIAYDFGPDKNVTNQPPQSGKITGRYLPSEVPEPATDGVFKSLSTEQAINSADLAPGPTYRGIVALTAGPGTPIVIEQEQPRTEINILNAFYAIEWVLFAGFAVFLWWRLVQDERLGLRGER